MVKRYLKILLVPIVLMLLVPAITFAADRTIWPTGYWGPILSCTGNYATSTQASALPSCQNLCDLMDTFLNILYVAMSIAIFIIAPTLLVVGGIMLMMSGANPEMLSKGKQTLTDTLIGLIIVICSYLIISTVLGALKITSIGGFGGGATCSMTSATDGGTSTDTTGTGANNE